MSDSNASGGYGLGGVLLIVFVVLKLVGTINWSWVWVLSPIWIPLCVLLAVVALGFAIAGLHAVITEWRATRRRGW